jgi:hypothetical protein
MSRWAAGANEAVVGVTHLQRNSYEKANASNKMPPVFFYAERGGFNAVRLLWPACSWVQQASPDTHTHTCSAACFLSATNLAVFVYPVAQIDKERLKVP